MNRESSLSDVYDRLLEAHGPQHWWPAESDFEMIVGAFLVQNTAWKNAALAIRQLREAEALSPEAIQRIETEELEGLIRSSGSFRQKAERLKGFVGHLYERHGGSLDHLLGQEAATLRAELLGLRGVGPETADSIALYAARHPMFVADAYSRRLFDRLGLLRQPTYEEVQEFVHLELPREAERYNELHALIVRHCVARCRAQPHCPGCPLYDRCPGHR